VRLDLDELVDLRITALRPSTMPGGACSASPWRALQPLRARVKAVTPSPYDRPDFFEGYSRLSRSVQGLDGAEEWPAPRALLPDMNGLRVFDLGCGFG